MPEAEAVGVHLSSNPLGGERGSIASPGIGWEVPYDGEIASKSEGHHLAKELMYAII